jgi:phosphopantothenoylcysteine synthetase/decarboxylase
MQEKTALLAATTPKGSANSYCSLLLNVKDEKGENLFNVIRASEFCKECLAKGVSETCTHKALARSKNKSSKKMKNTFLMYQEGDLDTAMEEMYAQESKSKGGIIPESKVKEFKENIRQLTNRPRCVYISIDPGGGGKSSQMGVVVAAEINSASSGVKLVVSSFFTVVSVFSSPPLPSLFPSLRSAVSHAPVPL